MKKILISIFLIIILLFFSGCKRVEEKDLTFIKYNTYYDDIYYNDVFFTASGNDGFNFSFDPMYQEITRYFRISDDYKTYKKNTIIPGENVILAPSKLYQNYFIQIRELYDGSGDNLLQLARKDINSGRVTFIEIIEKKDNLYYGYRLFVIFVTADSLSNISIDLVQSIRFKYDDEFSYLSDGDFELLTQKFKNQIEKRLLNINFINYYNFETLISFSDKYTSNRKNRPVLLIKAPYEYLIIKNQLPVLINYTDQEIINHQFDINELYETNLPYRYTYGRDLTATLIVDDDFIFPIYSTQYQFLPYETMDYLTQIEVLKAYEKRYWNDYVFQKNRLNVFNNLNDYPSFQLFPKLLINNDDCYVMLSPISKIIDFEIVTENNVFKNSDFELKYNDYNYNTKEITTQIVSSTKYYLSSLLYYNKKTKEAYNIKEAYELNFISGNDIEFIIDKLVNYVY